MFPRPGATFDWLGSGEIILNYWHNPGNKYNLLYPELKRNTSALVFTHSQQVVRNTTVTLTVVAVRYDCLYDIVVRVLPTITYNLVVVTRETNIS